MVHAGVVTVFTNWLPLINAASSAQMPATRRKLAPARVLYCGSRTCTVLGVVNGYVGPIHTQRK